MDSVKDIPGLTLYKAVWCPYCHEVLSFMEQAGIQIPVVDIDVDHSAIDTIYAAAGTDQVPCLMIDGEPMLESVDIIKYLGQLFGKADEARAYIDGQDIGSGGCSGGVCSL